MKRILLFFLVLCSSLLIFSKCEPPVDEDSWTTDDIKYAFYKQELAKLEYRYESDPSLQSPFTDELFDLLDRIFEDLVPDPTPGPEDDESCCDGTITSRNCGGEKCADVEGAIPRIVSDKPFELNIADNSGNVIGEASQDDKQKEKSGKYVYPIKLTVDSLPVNFNIELKEDGKTYFVRYRKKI